MKLSQIVLIIDDAVVILLISLFGINFHQTDSSLFSRLPYTFLPFLVAWIFFAFTLDLYKTATTSTWTQLWRVPVAAALSATVGAAIRSFILSAPVIPIFVVVMAVALTIALLLSRSVFILVFGKHGSTPENG